MGLRLLQRQVGVALNAPHCTVRDVTRCRFTGDTCDECSSSWTGDGCLDINYCENHVCLNGATCVNLPDDSTYRSHSPTCSPSSAICHHPIFCTLQM